jgi:NNP family nitrate/nitrite transporter-like MFS transporter
MAAIESGDIVSNAYLVFTWTCSWIHKTSCASIIQYQNIYFPDNDICFGFKQSEWKKYSEYAVETDPDQDDRSTEIKLCNFSRPHMRAFHCSWWGFFIAFFIWFAIAPLLSEIRDDLGLSKEEIWTSSIVGVGGTIFMRFLLGPLNDKYGPRVLMAMVLCLASIPTACTGFVNSAGGLAVLRLFIGAAGGTFVMCQYWASKMFTKEIVGTANALCAGWGNLGGGVTQLVMGAGLFPLFKWIYDGDASMAWRTVSVVPSVVAFASGIWIYKYSDDSPKGNFHELKKHGAMADVSAAASFRSGALNLNTWFLFVQYACCFGVELTMNNAAALYFKDQFGQTTESAAAIASIFGWMNLFARGLGGFMSDKLNARMGMRGRIWAQTVCLLAEGALVLVFANTATLGAAIGVMVIFSLFVQAAEGTSYGIVPYVDPKSTGSISGIVGAGGNTGAVCFGLGFRQLEYKQAFVLMGACIMGSSLLSVFIVIKGHAGIVFGKDEEVAAKANLQTLSVPDAEKAYEVEQEA